MGISVWPLESEYNVIHEDLFYSFLNQMYSGEGALQTTDLYVTADIEGVGVKVSPGGAIISYDSAPGGKRVFYNSVESKSGPNGFLNPSFDVDITGWSALGGSTVTRDTGVFHTTPASAKIVTNGASDYTRGIWLGPVNMKANPSQDTEVSFWVNAPAGVPVKLAVTEHNATLTQIAANEVIETGTGAWRKITAKFKTTANTRFIWCAVTISSASSQTFYVDTFQTTQNFEWSESFKPAHPTLPRLDRVVVQIRDQNVAGGGDTVTDGKFRVVAGTPTSGATLTNPVGAAAVPANCFLIANVLVPSGVTVITVSNIDNTVMATAALNVVIPEPPEVEVMPLGIPYPYMGTVAPAGYLMLDGAVYLRATYPALFAVCGTNYNIGGELATQFRLPDMRGRMPVGVGTHADINALGKNEGESTVGNRRPKHKHPGTVNADGTHSHNGSTDGQGNHNHGLAAVSNNAINSGDTPLATPATFGGGSFVTSDAGSHSHGLSTDSQGSHQHSYTAGPSANSPTDAPAFLTFNWIVKDGL